MTITQGAEGTSKDKSNRFLVHSDVILIDSSKRTLRFSLCKGKSSELFLFDGTFSCFDDSDLFKFLTVFKDSLRRFSFLNSLDKSDSRRPLRLDLLEPKMLFYLNKIHIPLALN